MVQQADASFKITGDAARGVAAMNKMRRATISTTASLAHLAKTGKQDVTKGIKATSNAVEDAGKKVKGFANQVAGLAFIIKTTFLFSLASVGITAINKFKAAIVDSIKALFEFEKQMAEINTLLDATPKQFVALRDQVRVIATQYSQDMEKMTRGTYDLISAGVALEDVQQVLSLSAKAATAGLTSIATAARASIATINAYSLEHSELERVLDLEFQTVKEGVLIYQDVADNIGIILPAAKKLGVSLEGIHAAFATLTKAGLGPPMAAIATARAFEQLIEREKELKDIGIIVFDEQTGAFMGITQVVEQLHQKLNRLNDQQRAMFFEMLNLEMRAGRAISGWVSQVDTLRETFEAMENSAGSMAAAFNKMAATADERIGIAINKLKDYRLELENVILPAITEVVENYVSLTEVTSLPILGTLIKTLGEIVTVTIREMRMELRLTKEQIESIRRSTLLTDKEVQDNYLKQVKTYAALLKVSENLKEFSEAKLRVEDDLLFTEFKILALRNEGLKRGLELLTLEELRDKIRKERVAGGLTEEGDDPDEVMRLLAIKKLLGKFEQSRNKNLDATRIKLIDELSIQMDLNDAVIKVLDMSDEQLKKEQERLNIKKEEARILKSFQQDLTTLQRLGIDTTEFLELFDEDKEKAIVLASTRATKVQALVSKWQNILIAQGESLTTAMNLTFEAAVQLEEAAKKALEAERIRKRLERQALREQERVLRESRRMVQTLLARPFMNVFDQLIDRTEDMSKAFDQMIKDIVKSIMRLLLSRAFAAFATMLFPSISAATVIVAGADAGGGIPGVPAGSPKIVPPEINRNTPIVIHQHNHFEGILPGADESIRRFTIEQTRVTLQDASKYL